jgi:peptidoglycan DL-endopeptidase CwlO
VAVSHPLVLPAAPARRRAFARPALALAFVAALAVGTAAPMEAASTTQFSRIKAIATAQLGSPWVWAAKGPSAFDCIGLVYYTYKRAGLLSKIGGQYRSVRGLWNWFAARGRASRTNPRRGDLVVWGGGKHIGIYLGKGRAISTLVRGVRIHGVHEVNLPFSTYLHVRISR